MKVFTGYEWLFKMFKGYRNEKKTAYINPSRDAQGRPVIGLSLLNDPDFSLDLVVQSPEGEERTILDWLEEIDYEPREE